MIKNILKLAQILDSKGEYELSDKLFKIAQNTPDVVVLPSKQKQQGFKSDSDFGYLTDASKYGTSSLGYDIEKGQYDPYSSPFKGEGPDTPFKPDYITPKEQQMYEETGNIGQMVARMDEALNKQNEYLSRTYNIINQSATSINKFKGAPLSYTDRYFTNVLNTAIGVDIKAEINKRDPNSWTNIINTFKGLIDPGLKSRYLAQINQSISSVLSAAFKDIQIQDVARYNALKSNANVASLASSYGITL